MGAANCLARLANSFRCDGTTIDHDPLVRRRRITRDRFAFGEVEATAERNGPNAHARLSRSSSPLKTCVAEPRMRIGAPDVQSIVSEPPLMSTRTGEVTRFVAIAAT